MGSRLGHGFSVLTDAGDLDVWVRRYSLSSCDRSASAIARVIGFLVSSYFNCLIACAYTTDASCCSAAAVKAHSRQALTISPIGELRMYRLKSNQWKA